jgi:hypothetical protein
MSTISVDTVAAKTNNGDLELTGDGTGTVNLPTGFKVNNVANSFLSSATNVTVAEGGTGASTLAANGVLFGNGTSALGATAVGTADQVLTSNGSGVAPTFQDAGGGGFTTTTVQATTSGTSWTFGSIPSGTQYIVISIQRLSFTASGSFPMIQLGDAGGIETAGHRSAFGYRVSNATFGLAGSEDGLAIADYLSDNHFLTTNMILNLINPSTNTWVATGNTAMGGTDALSNNIGFYIGYKSLSAELTQLRLYAAGRTGDAGQIRIAYL